MVKIGRINISLLKIIKRRQDYIPLDIESNGIKNEIINSSLWSGLDVGFQAVFSFIRSIIFARLLMPEDFGVLSIALVFSEFILMFTNFGFTASVVYQRNLNKEDLPTLWWANLLVESLAAIIIVTVAFFSKTITETSVVQNIIMLLSIQFILRSIGIINLSLLQRVFKFKILAIINALSSIISFVFILILLIIFKMGVYSLVIGMIIASSLQTLMQLYSMPWLPSLKFSLTAVKKHLAYGGWFFGLGIVGYINSSIDKIIISASLNNTELGFFEYAGRLPLILTSKLGLVLNKVMFSAFSNVQNNRTKIKELLSSLIRFNAFIIYPILFGLIILASDFVFIIYGEKWAPIIGPMQLLSIYGIFFIPVSPLRQLANGLGKPSLPFKWASILLPFNLIFIYILIKYYGIEGAAGVKIIFALLLLFTLGWELMRIIDLSIIKLLAQALPAFIASFFMGVIILIAKMLIMNSLELSIYRLMIEIFIGAIVYIIILRIFWKKDFYHLLSLVEKIKNKLSPSSLKI